MQCLWSCRGGGLNLDPYLVITEDVKSVPFDPILDERLKCSASGRAGEVVGSNIDPYLVKLKTLKVYLLIL